MYLVHLWLVEITCRLECISAAAKWSPGRQMRSIKRSGDPDIPNYRSDWRIEKFSCQSPCPNFWLSKYTVLVSIFLCRTAQSYCGPPRVPSGWSTGRTRIFVSCSTGACMMWCQRVTEICDCNNNVSVPWTWRLLRLHQLTEVSLVQLPIRLLASAFIFLLSHFKLITLPMHSPTNTRHNITSKDKFGTGTPHLADRIHGR